MPAATDPDDKAILEELEQLLCEIAAGRALNRAEATSYSECRSRLLASRLRPALPGFLSQCISLLRFRDFITLYDPGIEQRVLFLRRGFDGCRALFAPISASAPTRRPDARSQNWML